MSLFHWTGDISEKHQCVCTDTKKQTEHLQFTQRVRRNVFLVTSRAKGEHEEAQITKSSERPLQKHFNAEIETTSQKISNILNLCYLQ